MKKLSMALAASGWALFLASLFLPAILFPTFAFTFGRRYSLGWETAAYAFVWVFSFGTSPMAFALFIPALTNLGMLVSPWALLRSTARVRRGTAFVMLVATIVDCAAYKVFDGPRLFTTGYFLWCISFLLVTLALCL